MYVYLSSGKLLHVNTKTNEVKSRSLLMPTSSTSERVFEGSAGSMGLYLPTVTVPKMKIFSDGERLNSAESVQCLLNEVQMLRCCSRVAT